MDQKRVGSAENIMGNALTVKHEVFLTEHDSSLLRKIAKGRRCSLSQLLREATMEWLARRSYLEDEEKKALGVAT
jgi:predicted hydrolase (HD superfamily)